MRIATVRIIAYHFFWTNGPTLCYFFAEKQKVFITKFIFMSIILCLSVIDSNLHFSYQRRKQTALDANPDHPTIRKLSAEKRRKQWRENQRKHRAVAKHVKVVPDLTPEYFVELPEGVLERPSLTYSTANDSSN